MRKTFLTESLARLLRGAIGIACLGGGLRVVRNALELRPQRVDRGLRGPDRKEAGRRRIRRRAGRQAKIYAEANVDFVASWEDDADMPWAAVLDDTAVDPLTGCRIVTLDVQRRVETAVTTRGARVC